MNPIVQEIKQRFQQGDILTRLIFINVGVFLTLVIGNIIYGLFTAQQVNLGHWFALPTNDVTGFLFRPYTLISHMFVHRLTDVFHVLFNMVMLYFMGKLFLNYFNGKQLFGLYLLGGLISGAGLVLITILSPVFSVPGTAVGASAAIMAISIGIVAYTPNTTVNLFGMFPVKLMWVGIFYVISDLISFYDPNTGGHLGHLIGAGVGYWFAAAFKQGKDITVGINKFINTLTNLFQPQSKMKVVYSQEKVRRMSDEEYNVTKKATQEEIDFILDKISKSGYDSLTKKEKEILFHYSNK